MSHRPFFPYLVAFIGLLALNFVFLMLIIAIVMVAADVAGGKFDRILGDVIAIALIASPGAAIGVIAWLVHWAMTRPTTRLERPRMQGFEVLPPK